MKNIHKIPENKLDFVTETPDHSVVFTCERAEIDIPQDYFDKKIATIIGKDVECVGLFEIKVYDTDEEVSEDTNIKPTKTIFVKHYGMILCSPSSILEKRNEDGEKIQTLVFKKGDIFIKDTTIVVDPKVAAKFLDLMTLGYLPPVFPYEDIAQFWQDANSFNGVKVGSMSQASIELIISEVARDPKDLSRTFRSKLRDDPKTNRNGWKLINIRQLPKYSSTYACITSGDSKNNLISMIGRLRSGATQKISPVEESIM